MADNEATQQPGSFIELAGLVMINSLLHGNLSLRGSRFKRLLRQRVRHTDMQERKQ